MGKVLGDIGAEPVALRPATQVHRATLDGRAVAVKVLRPGMAQSLRGELGLVDALAALAGGALPGIDAPAMAREVRERLLDELDLEYEGGVQRSFHRALRRNDGLGVPAVHSDLTTEAVLVSDWVQGTPVDALEGDERERAARQLLVASTSARRCSAPSTPTPTRATRCSTPTAGSGSWTSARRAPWRPSASRSPRARWTRSSPTTPGGWAGSSPSWAGSPRRTPTTATPWRGASPAR